MKTTYGTSKNTSYKNLSDDFSERYSAHWKQTCNAAHKATNGKCCGCLTRDSEVVHHIMYADSMGAIAGRELPGVHCVPVCRICHDSKCHTPGNWIKDSIDPVYGNRNTTQYAATLRLNFKQLAAINNR